MLVPLASNPYFIKFMLSSHVSTERSQELAPWLAERLLVMADKLDTMIYASTTDSTTAQAYDAEHVIDITCKLLVKLLALGYERRDAFPVPSAVTQRLAPYLNRWSRKFGWSGGTTAFASGLLRQEEPIWTERAQMLRDKQDGFETCRREGCTQKYNLSLCAKCKTVVYCGPRHQLNDWKEHKLVCFETIY